MRRFLSLIKLTKIGWIVFGALILIAILGYWQSFGFTDNLAEMQGSYLWVFWPLWIYIILPLSLLIDAINADYLVDLTGSLSIFWILQIVYFYLIAKIISWLENQFRKITQLF